jgi:hypothetical protein
MIFSNFPLCRIPMNMTDVSEVLKKASFLMRLGDKKLPDRFEVHLLIGLVPKVTIVATEL